MPIFHLFTQMRIILNHHVWDHFSTQQNLNKRIWLFWAPVLEKKSNRIMKNIVFCLWVHWVVIHYHTLPMNAILHQFKDITMPDASWLDVQPKNITTDKQNLKNKRTRHCQKPLSWSSCCILGSPWPQTKPQVSNKATGPETRPYTPNRAPICTHRLDYI